MNQESWDSEKRQLKRRKVDSAKAEVDWCGAPAAGNRLGVRSWLAARVSHLRSTLDTIFTVLQSEDDLWGSRRREFLVPAYLALLYHCCYDWAG